MHHNPQPPLSCKSDRTSNINSKVKVLSHPPTTVLPEKSSALSYIVNLLLIITTVIMWLHTIIWSTTVARYLGTSYGGGDFMSSAFEGGKRGASCKRHAALACLRKMLMTVRKHGERRIALEVLVPIPWISTIRRHKSWRVGSTGRWTQCVWCVRASSCKG